jgi:flagellar biosynthetic protein FlhB
MAGQDKTEAPTAKRLSEARKRGQLPVSKEITTAGGLLALFGVLGTAGPMLLSGYQDLLREGLLTAGRPTSLTIDSVFSLMAGVGLKALILVGIPVVAVGLAGLLLGLAQTKFNFGSEALKPDIKRLNPLQGLKRVFGPKGAFEVGKELIKISVIGFVAYRVLWPHRPELAQMVGASPDDVLPYLAGLCLTLGLSVSGVYIALAIADYLFQRWQTMKELRMTKEEVRQEYKQMETPPEIKRMIRQRAREAAQKRMLTQVPDADVVITNPTHYAVALKYGADAPAPRIVAKGQDRMAARIREMAIDNDVEIVADPPLARSLHATCEVGDWLPEDLFVAVAEVLAYVYKRREDRRRSGAYLDE